MRGPPVLCSEHQLLIDLDNKILYCFSQSFATKSVRENSSLFVEVMERPTTTNVYWSGKNVLKAFLFKLPVKDRVKQTSKNKIQQSQRRCLVNLGKKKCLLLKGMMVSKFDFYSC